MQFIYPAFLWAMLALAIPVIIHLFYFRRFKKVYFTNVKYLKEIKEETSNRNKLKNLLILLARCLAVASLVFAFAQPFIPKGDGVKSGLNHVSVFVDNSFSMTATRQDVPLIDYAKEKARSIINSYTEDDRFQVLTHDFEGRHQRFVSKEDALAYVEEIAVSPSVQPLDNVLKRQEQLMQTGTGNRISYLISDFQKSISDFSDYRDTLMEVNLLPVQTTIQKNISVDSAWFEGPVPFLYQDNKLAVKVRNNSKEDATDVKLSFRKDGQEKPIGIWDIPAGQAVTDTVHFTIDKSGWHEGVVVINDYPVQFDDEYFIAFEVPDTIKALFINETGPNRYMDALFKGVKHFSLSNQSVNQLQYQRFPDYDLIILNDLKNITSGLANELLQYVRGGGKVVVFPGKNINLDGYNNFFVLAGTDKLGKSSNQKREVSSINTEEFIFSDVYINTGRNLKLPVTTFSYDVETRASGSQEKLLAYRDGGAFLSKYRVGDGQIFICSGPLDSESSDLVFNAEVFVPMIYKMAISSTVQKGLSYKVSNHMVIETKNQRQAGDYVYKVSDGKTEFIPGQNPAGSKMILTLSDQVAKAGFYDLSLDEKVVARLAFNYDRRESDMETYKEEELEGINPENKSIKVITTALQADMGTSISEKDRGIVLWKWFIIAALIFLALETLLVRFFKN